MKKLLITGGITILGLAAFLFVSGMTSHNAASASTKDKVVLFGKVDFSDEDDKDTEVSSTKGDDKDQKDSWLENFISTHKTPFSKTIRK